MIWILLSLPLAALALATMRTPLWLWTAVFAAYLGALATLGDWPAALLLPLGAVFTVVALLLNLRPLRRRLLTAPIFKLYRRVLPQMSQTESDALEAGTVWWEGDLFGGRPDWAKMLAFPQAQLSAQEQAFLDNETAELCAMADDWETSHYLHDLPPHVWQFIKDKGFLGLIIPKRYGGKEYSAYAHAQVVMKLSTRCSAAAVSVMVPNSLGPAELLLHYGTEEQKNHYLPRLARGQDIPCFALTSPQAGSDAAAMPDTGVVCKGMWEGREVVGMRVTWDKRYITLAPVATVLGLAFRLYDPEHLLGAEEDLGITCALIPTSHPGVVTGRRHLPLNAVFQNGPTHGKDVFMPLDWIIGGPKMAGQGWRMLMECLAAGRAISLPSGSTGMAKLVARTVGAYSRVRSQFKTPIGKFEGIQEPLARIAGNLYMMDAARTMTVGAVDRGEKPSVLSAIVKYHLTERGRQVVSDGMDIVGGKGICLGPSNFIGRAYQQVPVAITVEGANILTRSLIIFGQGAIRCHPYVLAEMHAAGDADQTSGLKAFDAAFFSHLGFMVSNAARSLVTALSGARFVSVPATVAPDTRAYYQQLSRFSSAFAFAADVAMFVVGGDLKRREKLSARLGDILSLMYLASATLKRFEAEGQQHEDAALLHWSVGDALHRLQTAFDGVIANFPNRVAAGVLRLMVFPLGRQHKLPSDELGAVVSELLISPSATRDRLTAGMYLPQDEADGVGLLEQALAVTIKAEQLEAKLRAAQRAGRLKARTPDALLDEARAAGLVSAAEQACLVRRNLLRDKVIAVDDFPADFGLLARSEPKAKRAAA